jgi:DNA-binding response OmpR family regulator
VPEPAPSRQRRVLVADDESSMRLLLRVNLPLAGYEVVEAADGEAALARIRGQTFDLLLLDVMMPKLSGFELAERLRADPATSDASIVFVSARADRADVQRGLDLGAIDYITKPFDPLLLGAHLNALLDGGAPGTGGVSRSMLDGERGNEP